MSPALPTTTTGRMPWDFLWEYPNLDKHQDLAVTHTANLLSLNHLSMQRSGVEVARWKSQPCNAWDKRLPKYCTHSIFSWCRRIPRSSKTVLAEYNYGSCPPQVQQRKACQRILESLVTIMHVTFNHKGGQLVPETGCFWLLQCRSVPSSQPPPWGHTLKGAILPLLSCFYECKMDVKEAIRNYLQFPLSTRVPCCCNVRGQLRPATAQFQSNGKEQQQWQASWWGWRRSADHTPAAPGGNGVASPSWPGSTAILGAEFRETAGTATCGWELPEEEKPTG